MAGGLKHMWNMLLVVVGALVALALLLRWREPSMIYFPSRQIELTPERVGFQFEDVWLTTSDGVRIHGWYLPAPLQRGRLVVLFLHGNAGNISHRYEKFEAFRDLGVDVFIIDYRGYGRSEGRPDEQGTYRDALAAYEYLTGRPPVGRALLPRQIVLYGESLGAAVAVDLATKVPVGGVVTEEAFTSTADVGQKMFPFLPVRWLVKNKYDTLSKIGRINAPLLIFHSRDDEYFSMRHAERLLAAAQPPKHLVELRGGHNDAFLVSNVTWRHALKQFFDKLAASEGT
jgi:fermentation-respiration switch protein FrsA (DUF1100 family)